MVFCIYGFPTNVAALQVISFFFLLTVYSLSALVSYSMLKQFYPLPLSMLESRKKSLPSANLKTMALAVYLQI